MIRVLVVEDEPVAAEAHRAYVDRTPGFTTAAVAGTGAAALDALARQPVDLVLLDMNLPDAHGIDLCRRIRGAGAQVDVLAVTSARELTTVRAAAAHGVVGYLLKPFTYPALRDRLAAYAEYRERLHAGGDAAGQDDVDRVLGGVRPTRPGAAAQGDGPGDPRRRGRRRPRRRGEALGSGDRRADRRLADHRPPLPGVPRRHRAGRPRAPVRRRRPPGAGVPLALSRVTLH